MSPGGLTRRLCSTYILCTRTGGTAGNAVIITGNLHVCERTRVHTGVGVGVFLGGVDESIRFWK
jgi:hypothetical protein